MVIAPESGCDVQKWTRASSLIAIMSIPNSQPRSHSASTGPKPSILIMSQFPSTHSSSPLHRYVSLPPSPNAMKDLFGPYLYHATQHFSCGLDDRRHGCGSSTWQYPSGQYCHWQSKFWTAIRYLEPRSSSNVPRRSRQRSRICTRQAGLHHSWRVRSSQWTPGRLGFRVRN